MNIDAPGAARIVLNIGSDILDLIHFTFCQGLPNKPKLPGQLLRKFPSAYE